MQYKIGSGTTWTKIDNWHTVSNIANKSIVHARLTDGKNYGQEATLEVKDIEGPVVDMWVTNRTENTISVQVSAYDLISGMPDTATNTYRYYLGTSTTAKKTTNEYTYEYTGLSASTEYQLKVIVRDKASNTTTMTITGETITKYASQELEEGDYVNYKDKNGTTRKCIVLYGPSSQYGIQIITSTNLVTQELGNGTGKTTANTTEAKFDIARTSFNNSENTLYEKAHSYMNTSFSDMGRCVGSPPNGTRNDTNEYLYNTNWLFNKDYFTSYNGTFKKFTDESSQYEDIYAMENIENSKSVKIKTIGSAYWIASPYTSYGANRTSGIVSYIDSTGFSGSANLLKVNAYDTNTIESFSYKYGIRPVFNLLNTVKITGGAGTSASPYTLGI